jgi:adenylate cyclase class 2
MREVEVKYRVHDTAALLTALDLRGVRLGPPIHQDDQAYAPDGWTYGDSKIGVPFARLRTVHGRHFFTLKRPAENALSCDEHETEITNRDHMHAAIIVMGFSPTVRITKTRRTGHLHNTHICVDQVTHLGTFMELERLIPPDASGDIVQAELTRLVTSLAIDATRTEETYDSLLHAALTPR